MPTALPDPRDVHRTLDLALRVGDLLLSSGAGAADVSSTILAVVRACGLRSVDIDVTFTALTLSWQASADEPPVLAVRHVQYRDIDYEDLTLVDALVRDLQAGRLDREQARSRLARIVSTGHRLPRWAVTLGTGVTGASVALLLGGPWQVVVVAFVAAAGIDRIQRAMSRRRWPLFYQQVAGALFAALLAVAVSAADIGVEPSALITSGIVVLLSGIGFVGALQDALTGYPITAGARVLEAILATAGIIAGVSGGLGLGSSLGVHLVGVDAGTVRLSYLPVAVAGAAAAGASFAFASYAPPRSLLPIAVVAGVGQGVASLLLSAGQGRTWASAVAATAIGMLAWTVAGRVRVPPLTVVVSGIVPLLPGLSIYRGLSLLADGRSAGIVELVGAASTALGLAAGVIFGEYVAQPLRREARRLERRLSGPRLVGPFDGVRTHGVRRRRHRY